MGSRSEVKNNWGGVWRYMYEGFLVILLYKWICEGGGGVLDPHPHRFHKSDTCWHKEANLAPKTAEVGVGALFDLSEIAI